VLDLDGEVPELRALATYYAGQGGALWAAERGDGAIVGMVGVRPVRDGPAAPTWEVCKMYVAAEERGTGLAHRLIEAAEAHARAAGAERLTLWSDTRFERAHRFYEKRGYVRAGPIRALHDLSNSIEFRYAKPARGLVVEALDAAAAASAEHRLADNLNACVADGAFVSYFAPLAPDAARAFWRGTASDVATGSRLLFAAWLDGALVGTVQLALGMPENQRHRAEVVKLLVDPAARGRGVGRALMRRVEEAARGAGRTLLTLDTTVGHAAEALYRTLGWQEVGRVPGLAIAPLDRRTRRDTVLFWKGLEER
jgi:GNAT superfamily N-acetyltransferase